MPLTLRFTGSKSLFLLRQRICRRIIPAKSLCLFLFKLNNTTAISTKLLSFSIVHGLHNDVFMKLHKDKSRITILITSQKQLFSANLFARFTVWRSKRRKLSQLGSFEFVLLQTKKVCKSLTTACISLNAVSFKRPR